MRRTSALMPLTVVLLAVTWLAAESVALAEPGESRQALFNGRAFRKAEDAQVSGRAPRVVRSVGSDLPQNGAAVSDFALSGFTSPDFSQSFIEERSDNPATMARIEASRTLLFRPQLTEASDTLEWESKTAAEQYFFYEAYGTASKLVLNSDLRPMYEAALRAARQLRDYTSLRIGRKSDGELAVVSSSSTPALVAFRVRATPSAGVEPRIEIGDHLIVRHNFLEQNSLLEFRTEF